MAELRRAIDEESVIATHRGRTDLVQRLERARMALEDRTITTAVAGEFKRGKSSLINALLQTAVCPTDADIVTAVPTVVRYGRTVSVSACVQLPDQDGLTLRPESLERLPLLVSEPNGSGPNPSDVRSVEVRLPHRVLRSGLCLVDTPGVGGLESEHGQITLASLDAADAVLFVTDASQELTAPELDFLMNAVRRCPSAALVMAKTDLYPWWREIAETNRRHLAAAGLDVPVLPVSSFLRLRARKRPSLNEESGFEPLMAFLATDVVLPATARVAATVAHDVDFVADQLAQTSDAERVVLAMPEERETVLRRLNAAQSKARKLATPTATWQQTLADGIQDLVSDVEHDMHRRLRDVQRGVDEVIDGGDPLDSWPDTVAWLRRQVAVAALANRDLLIARARDLSDDVAAQFDLEAGHGVEFEFDEVSKTLERLDLPSASALDMSGGRLSAVIVAARGAAFLPAVTTAVGFGLLPALGIALAAGAVGAAAAGLFTLVLGKGLRDETKRRRQQRQQQGKVAARRYLDEVAFVMNKETRDSLRRTQRGLRDEFQARASILRVSTEAAMASAQRAATLAPQQRSEHARRLEAQTSRLAEIRSRMKDISALPGGEGSGAVAAGSMPMAKADQSDDASGSADPRSEVADA